MLETGAPPLQRPALDALVRIGPKSAVETSPALPATKPATPSATPSQPAHVGKRMPKPVAVKLAPAPNTTSASCTCWKTGLGMYVTFSFISYAESLLP